MTRSELIADLAAAKIMIARIEAELFPRKERPKRKKKTRKEINALVRKVLFKNR